MIKLNVRNIQLLTVKKKYSHIFFIFISILSEAFKADDLYLACFFLENFKLDSIAATSEKFPRQVLQRAASADRNLRPGEALQRSAAELLAAMRVSSDGEFLAGHGQSGTAANLRPVRGPGRARSAHRPGSTRPLRIIDDPRRNDARVHRPQRKATVSTGASQ